MQRSLFDALYAQDVIGQISIASAGQESDIVEIDRAITDRDSFTQQNAAQVEEAAAAACSIQDQANNLTRVVDKFALEGNRHSAAHPIIPAGCRS